MRTKQLVGFIVISIIFPSCALLKKQDGQTESSVQSVHDQSHDQSPEITSRVESRLEHENNQGDVVEGSSFERDDLKDVDRIFIRVPRADITLGTGTSAKRGHLKVSLVAGSKDCKVRLRRTEDLIEILEPLDASNKSGSSSFSAVNKIKSTLPNAARCHYAVSVALHEAAEAQIELVRGSLLAEGWDEPLRVKMDWGDVDVGSVGALSLVCGRCDLTGENIGGPLFYKIDSGNVGLMGLEDSVEGETLGDTVLKWRRIRSRSSVKISSRAGDVILSFPGAVPLAIDLKAPRGEVKTKCENESGGIPVSVSAGLGNVQVLRALREASP